MKILQTIVLCLCLIAFIPKESWNALSPEDQGRVVQSLMLVYFSEHPGETNAQVQTAETPHFVIIKISKPRQEVDREAEIRDSHRHGVAPNLYRPERGSRL